MRRKMKKQRKEDIDDKPSFFKIMFPVPNISQQLRIPPDFIDHIDKCAFEKAMFRGPCGHGWPVKLCKNEEGVFVKDGWDRFFENHSLGHFEFLIFIYDGESCFDVRIFGKDGLEIVIPFRDDASNVSSSFEHFSENEHKIEREDVNGEAVLVNGRRRRGRPRKNSPSDHRPPFSPLGKDNAPGQDARHHGSREPKQLGVMKTPKKKMKGQIKVKSFDEETAYRLKDIGNEKVYQSQRVLRRKSKDIKQLGVIKCSKKKIKAEIIESSREETAFRCKDIENEKVHRSYEDKNARVTVSDSNPYDGKTKRGGRRVRSIDSKIEEKGDEDKNARVKASGSKLFDRKTKRGRPRVRSIGSKSEEKGKGIRHDESGYLKKPKEKKRPKVEIKEEVIEVLDDEPVFRSKIFNRREVRDVNHERKDALHSRFPFFKKCIDELDVNQKYVFRIPRDFAENYLPDSSTPMVLRNEKGRSWEVTFIALKYGFRFSGGWVSFMRDNELKLGDHCTFELVKETEMKVCISRS